MVVAFCEARNEADTECERTSVDREKKNLIYFFPHRGMAVAFCKARNEADAECERTSVDKEKKN